MSRARTRLLLSTALALVVAVAVGLALFQPWKLWVDDRVDQAAPPGVTPIAAATATTAAPTTAAAQPSVPATSPPAASVSTTAAPGTTAEPAPDEPSTTAAAPSTVPAVVPAATAFVSLDHGTSGDLVVLADEDGNRFVRFVDLATDNGPDLRVYLSTNPVDGPEEAFDDDFVELGRLQGNLGSQNYEVPPDVDLSRFRSVVIWCDRFNSAFGAAPLV